MKRIAIALVLALALVACGGDQHDHEHATPTIDSAPSVETAPDPEEAFLYLFRNEIPGARSIPDAELLDAGYKTCALIGQMGLEPFLMELSKRNADVEFSSAMVASSIVALCPEYTPTDWSEEEIGA